ncbi:MAG: ABC transporter ATP-binding protein [Thermoproteales archaeon]|nr:ABC transporter ATP-binding protein [Thermoproteales archaeon]
MEGNVVVSMKSIKKVYPDGTVALRGVDFYIKRGEIVSLLGENGAGKTTLMKILSGLLQPTEGEIYVNGKKVRFKNPADALKAGIGMVHQHFALVPTFTPVENILLFQEDRGQVQALSMINLEAAKEKLSKLIEETGLTVPFDNPIELLSLGVQQRVEILKVLSRGTNILILDEPTSSLTPIEVQDLFKILRKLKASGRSVVFITHKLKEAIEISDRIVVLRKGLVVGEVPAGQASPEQLAVMMVGKEITPQLTRRDLEPGDPILIVKNLKVMSDYGTVAVKNVSFEVRTGEIFGIAGVEGNGQSELVQAITGLRPVAEGEIVFKGTRIEGLNPKKIYKMGIAHIPEDRQRYGLVLDLSFAENSIIGRQDEPQFLLKLSRLNWQKIMEYARSLIQKFDILTPGLKVPVKSLSGGNQQKLVVGRELSKEPVLIVAVNPTRGLDIASTLYIRELLLKMRNEGKAVLLVSADLDEIMQLSDRVAVIYEGEFLGVGKIEEFTREQIGLMMGGIKKGV